MTAQQAKTNRNEQARYEVRDRMAQAAAEGELTRGERQSLQDAALERAGELAEVGRLAEGRRVLELNYFVAI